MRRGHLVTRSLASYSRCRAIQENWSLPQKSISNLPFGTGTCFMGPLGCIDRVPRLLRRAGCTRGSATGRPQRRASPSIFNGDMQTGIAAAEVAEQHARRSGGKGKRAGGKG